MLTRWNMVRAALVGDVAEAGCNSSWDKNGRKRKKLFGRSADHRADAHSRGHGMAQVALSRAQPSSPHRPPSRSPRARPFTFTSATARELGDRAALARRLLGPQAIALESETYLDTLSMCVRVKIGFNS